MKPVVEELKGIVQDVLGDIASEILLGKVNAALDEGSATNEGLILACTRIEKMVNLFLGTDKAKIIGQRFREALTRAGLKTP